MPCSFALNASQTPQDARMVKSSIPTIKTPQNQSWSERGRFPLLFALVCARLIPHQEDGSDAEEEEVS